VRDGVLGLADKDSEEVVVLVLQLVFESQSLQVTSSLFDGFVKVLQGMVREQVLCKQLFQGVQRHLSLSSAFLLSHSDL
jgi:hypothetical protein